MAQPSARQRRTKSTGRANKPAGGSTKSGTKAETRSTPGAAKAGRSSGKGRARAAENPDDRRKQILKAAVRVFADKGYHGCRISDVAEEAGVAYGLVYHYFGNKDALLRTIFETNWSVFVKATDEIVSADMPTYEKLRQIIDFLINAYEASPLIVKVLILEFGRSSRLGDALDTPELGHVFKALERLFRTAHDRGELRDGIAPTAAAVILLGAVESALASFVVAGGGRGSPDLEETRRSLHTVFVDGLLVAGDHPEQT